MRDTRRTISIRKLPPKLDAAQQKALYRELESCINVARPSVVLDCSMLAQLDRPAIHLLLCCLEEAMKRNGDVRLAALQPHVKAMLKSSELGKIFEVFDCIADAVESFRTPRVSVVAREIPAQAVEISSRNQTPAQVNAA